MIDNIYVILYRIVMVMYSILRISIHGDTLNEVTSITNELNELQREIRNAYYNIMAKEEKEEQ